MSKLIRLPGLIDIHVHLRDPGQTYKEDFYTGTSAALAGGVTAVFDMPNNLEPIFTCQKLMEKINIAEQKAVCDWGLYFGTDGKNTDEFEKIADKVVGLKVYLNMTTGRLVIDDEELVEKVFKLWPKSKIIVVHAEGEKINLAIRLAEKYGNKLHVTHINTRQLLKKIMAAKKNKLNITCDVTPHHLFLTAEDIKPLKGFGIMKPPLSSREDIDYLWDHLSAIDCIASDHGPHTTEEKQEKNPPTGVPGLETLLPLLLTASSAGRITFNDIVRLTSTNPAKIFNMLADNNTYIEVDLEEKYLIEDKNLKTKCGWSPFAGREAQGRIKRVFIRGTKAFENGQILVSPGFGKSVSQ